MVCDVHSIARFSFETSAKEAINVEQAFQAACKSALAQESETDMCVNFKVYVRCSMYIDKLLYAPRIPDMSDSIQIGVSNSSSSGCAC